MDSGPEGEDDQASAVMQILGSAEYWRRDVPALMGDGARVVAPYLLGFGMRAKPVEDYRVALWGTQLEDLLVELRVKRCVLISNSIGSLVAIQATATIPRMECVVDAIVYCNTACDLTPFR